MILKSHVKKKWQKTSDPKNFILRMRVVGTIKKMFIYPS